MPINIQQLSHTYLPGSALAYPALSNISLTISEGEFLGIIGHTGSGKSTLIQHLNGLLLPTEGSVLVDGLDTREKKLRKQIRSLVGMVFQYPEYQLFDETVARDVAFGPKNMGLAEDEIATRVNEALRLVGLDPEAFSEKSPFELSGGEKRRAALAGILAMRPKYLVLDEPMAGLDPRGRRGDSRAGRIATARFWHRYRHGFALDGRRCHVCRPHCGAGSGVAFYGWHAGRGVFAQRRASGYGLEPAAGDPACAGAARARRSHRAGLLPHGRTRARTDREVAQ